MPTYDYLCEDCGYHFEEFQSITAEPLTKCPKCQGRVKRLIGAGNGFLFKGNGFYITDYRSESYKKDKKKAEGKSFNKSEAKSSAKTNKKVA
ncbi:zinc ribbon domain-containing protein [Methanosarcinales archaeon]|nr:MAG: zinc ribbon domain-containing protein [Methanosarcinales archaeon]